MANEPVILTGIPISDGIVTSKAYIYERISYEADNKKITPSEIDKECLRFQEAVTRAEEELTEIVRNLQESAADKADIFRAHQVLLSDDELIDSVLQNIRGEKFNSQTAVIKAFDEFIQLLSEVKDDLIAARTADLFDVRNRLLRILLGKEEQNLSNLKENVIVVACDLLPSDTAVLDREHVVGIITENGGATSHTAIIASGYHIPSVLGVKGAMTRIHDGQEVIIDTTQGTVVLQATAALKGEYEQKAHQLKQRLMEEETYALKPAVTKDLVSVQIGLNVGDELFVTDSDKYDYIGLFRTEFLYMEGTHLPTEEEQFVRYKAVLEKAKQKPVILRTLDIGGDKTLTYMELPKEDNPFLGKRALRLCFSEEEIFRTQLRAALRASVFGNLKIMFPMVGGIDDYRRAKSFVEEVKSQLREENVPFRENVPIGIMIEIPSIALMADLVAEEVDFASVGTNDLTQYVCAADRMNPEVSSYYQKLSPAMVRILGYIIEQFQLHNKEISVCGELAGDPKCAVVLAGLGLRKFSMSETKIPGVKAVLAKVDTKRAQLLTKQLCSLHTEKEIEKYINEYLK